MGKKNASRRHSEKRRRRTLKQRRRPRSTPRQAKRSLVRAPSIGHDEDHDDCPYCVAARELGIEHGASIDERQYAAYRARVDKTPLEQMDDALLGETMRLVVEFSEQYERLN